MKKHQITYCITILFIVALPIFSQGQGTKANPVVMGTDTIAKWTVTDPFYPKYHVAPPYGWMNDPHPVYMNGAFHLFYQFSFVRDNPYGRRGLQPGQRPQRTWGHAMSTDLVHWKHMPVALTSSLHGRANDPHIFSGIVVDNNGVGTALYTINNTDIYMSTSKDKDLATFTKYPNNPVIAGPPAGLKTTGQMRDPWVWKEGNTWYMIIGSGLDQKRGPVLPLYKSANLKDWEYMHPFYNGEESAFDFLGDADFCECPAFFQLGNKYVLVLSDKATYLVGRYENHRFIPEKRSRLDFGEAPGVKNGGIYVPLFALDNKGRRVMFGWADRWRSVETNADEYVKAGWSGMQTLPRVLTLNDEGLINFEPAEELNALRSEHKEFSGLTIAPDSAAALEGVQGMQLEIKSSLEPGTASNVGIEILDVAEPAKIYYNVPAKSVCYNQVCVPLNLGRKENIELRVFVDGKTVEVYANKKIVLTEQLKPVGTDGYRTRIYAEGGRAKVVKADIWKMGSIW